MRIIGIDPGSVTTGYGVIDHTGSTLQLVEQGCLHTKRTDDFAERLDRIFTGLSEVMTRTSPTAAAIEAPFAGVNVKSLVQLAHARGVAMLAARRSGLELFEYSPRSVKSAVVGYGAAEKEQVAKMVMLLVSGLQGSTLRPDAADALAVAICHAHSYRLNSRIQIAR